MIAEEIKTLMLVEDEMIIAIGKKMELEKYGYNVIHANTGEQSVTLSTENREIDLILMDIDLGKGIDGTEAAALIIKEKDIPVLFMSSHMEPEVVEKTERITSYGYVVKSSSITVLDASIKMAFKLFDAQKEINKQNMLIKAGNENLRVTIEDLEIGRNRLASIFRAAPTGIGVVTDRILVEINQRICEMTGYQEEELIGRNARFLYPTQEDFDSVGIEKYEQIKHKGTGTVETRWKCKDGKVIDLLLSSTPLDVNDFGKGVTFTALDITELKQAKRIEEEITANLNSLLNNRKESIWSIDSNYNYIILNDFYKEAYYSVYNVVLKNGMNALDALPPEQVELWKSKYNEALSGEAIVFEFTNPGNQNYKVSLNPVFTDKEVTGVTALSIDITDRKQTEELLKSNEAQYQQMFQTNVAIKLIIDPDDGQLVDVNNAASEFYGYDKQKLCSMKISDINILSQDEVKLEMDNAKDEKRLYFNFKHRLASGEIRDVEVYSGPINSENKTLLYSIIHDITMSKKAEDLIKQTRKNYETFFDSIDDFLFVLDEQGNIIHTNSTVIDRLGYSVEELSGQSVLMVHTPECREEAGRIVGEMLAGTADFCPVPIMTKSGNQIPVETRVSPGVWNGKSAIFGVTKDISRVQLSEEKFSKLFHLNPSACGLSDLDDHTYLEVNEAFYNLLGFGKNEVIGRTATDLGILSSEAINVIMSKADSQGNVRNVEAKLKAKNGEVKHVLLSSENIFVQDKGYRFTAISDITERKIAEDKIKSLLEEKELILKEVHHRIKNNMNTLIGILSLQADTLDDKLCKEALEDAEGRVGSMMILYDKLYQSDNFSEVSVKEYLPPLVTEVLNNFPNSNVINLNIDVDDFIMGVKEIQTLGIIINELLTNVMKYAFTGRDSGLIKFSLKENKREITLTLQDNGNGLPLGFDINKTKGFGLVLIKMLTQQLDGSFTIENHNGTRSVIKFTL
ncbi:MAG: PAS domain S-box protein [Spirochaetia bacterium]|jgi:PAS domain S-box-containing protein|nr:PAS domain S-box protein [Spirochaetia bacterium]